jgi:hypothetical protein
MFTKWRLAVALLVVPLSVSTALAGEVVPTEVLKRSHARPDGTQDVKVYVRNHYEYQLQWERFGYKSDRPPVNFQRRVVVFIGTHESGSCPLRFQRTVLHREDRAITVRLSNGPYEVCTDDWVPRSFVLSLRRASLPEGELAIRIRRV